MEEEEENEAAAAAFAVEDEAEEDQPTLAEFAQVQRQVENAAEMAAREAEAESYTVRRAAPTMSKRSYRLLLDPRSRMEAVVWNFAKNDVDFIKQCEAIINGMDRGIVVGIELETDGEVVQVDMEQLRMRCTLAIPRMASRLSGFRGTKRNRDENDDDTRGGQRRGRGFDEFMTVGRE